MEDKLGIMHIPKKNENSVLTFSIFFKMLDLFSKIVKENGERTIGFFFSFSGYYIGYIFSCVYFLLEQQKIIIYNETKH